jgi:hypothetical protein
MNLLLPFWMRVGIARDFRLWLPLWLLWPVWLLVLFAFLITALLATLATGSFAFRSALAATGELHRVAAALRGADCEIQAGSKYYSLSFL